MDPGLPTTGHARGATRMGRDVPVTAATPMPVATSSELWPLIVAGLGEMPRPREKQSPDGRGTFTTGTVLITANPDGSTRANKTASVNVIDADPSGYALGTTFQAAGKIWVTPYTPDGGRSTLSVTVERLVPVTAPAPSRRGE